MSGQQPEVVEHSIASLLNLPAGLFLSIFSFAFIFLGLKKKKNYQRQTK